MVSPGGARTSDQLIKSAFTSTPAGYGSYALLTFVTGCSRHRAHVLLPIHSSLRVVFSQVLSQVNLAVPSIEVRIATIIRMLEHLICSPSAQPCCDGKSSQERSRRAKEENAFSESVARPCWAVLSVPREKLK